MKNDYNRRREIYYSLSQYTRKMLGGKLTKKYIESSEEALKENHMEIKMRKSKLDLEKLMKNDI